MRRLSLTTAILIPVALALVGNLATNTIQVSASWWPWAVWSVSGLLIAATVVIEVRRKGLGDQASSADGDTGLDETAALLASAVKAQWRDEEEQRRVHDPFPLPIHWHPVAEQLVDHWANIRRAPAGAEPGPVALTGRLDRIVDVYRRIPSGRLVVLVRAGAGKTILALRFVLDLLEARASTDPVPVIFGLGSWNPATTPLRNWLTGQLLLEHPRLAAAGRGATSLAAALVATGHILPVLDGFDEIADGLHGIALQEINATAMPLLLTSRVDEYTVAIDVLTAAAGIEIDDLTLPDLGAYLPRTTRRSVTIGEVARESLSTVWDPVLARLRNQRTDPAARALGQVLSTPLMVALARAIYSDSSDRDPAELLDTGRFDTPKALEDHLLDAFTPAAYQNRARDQRPGRRWDSVSAQHSLGYLAWHLNLLRTRDLALWQLGDTTPRLTSGLLAGGADFLVFSLASLLIVRPVVALAEGLVYGLAGGLSFGLGSRLRPSRAEMRFRATAMRFIRRFTVGFAVGLVYGLVLGLGLSTAFSIGFAGGLATGSYIWLQIPTVITTVPTPTAVLRQDRVAALAFGLAAGLAFGTGAALISRYSSGAGLGILTGLAGVSASGLVGVAAGALIGGLSYGRVGGLVFGIAMGVLALMASWNADLVSNLGSGLAYGTMYGFAIVLVAVLPRAWGTYTVSRLWLALRGDLPWRLLAFLEDAHRRGVLRQSGGVYQFSHARLQDRLAHVYRGHSGGAKAVSYPGREVRIVSPRSLGRRRDSG